MNLQTTAVHDAALPNHEGGVDWARVRADFPLLMREVHGKPLVYFDNANTGQKPLPVIASQDEFYRRQNANVSRVAGSGCGRRPIQRGLGGRVHAPSPPSDAARAASRRASSRPRRPSS